MFNLTDPRFQYTPACATDIRHTWARYCPVWAERMKHPQCPLPVASVQIHHAPVKYTGHH